MSKKQFYITTAIDYVNAEPHIGHAYQKIVADVLARWHRLQGDDVFFVTGTDEHGKKVAEAAKAAGKEPKIFVDEISPKFKKAWESLHVEPDIFIRTTDDYHQKTVQELIKKIHDNGDIYKDTYKGLYCTGCEAYYTEKDADNLNCPVHKKPLETLEEESYFFKLSKYQDFLLDCYNNKDFVLPQERKNEVINRVKEGLKDISITRTSFSWGIPFPLEKGHVTYVWFEALMNYYSATQQGKEHFWPANVHLLGKDNIWFHCVYWPAICKAASIPLPKTIFNHGFLTFNGEKISKSLGNAIAIPDLVEKYGADAIRYFCLRQVPLGEDGDFSEDALVERHNGELANKLGNLVSRVSTLAEKYGLEEVDVDTSNIIRDVKELIEQFELDKALKLLFAFIDTLNQFVQDKKVWETRSKEDLFELVTGIRLVSVLLWPFIPETCEKIANVFNFKISLDSLKQPLKISNIKKSEILFNKIE